MLSITPGPVLCLWLDRIHRPHTDKHTQTSNRLQYRGPDVTGQHSWLLQLYSLNDVTGNVALLMIHGDHIVVRVNTVCTYSIFGVC